MAIDDNDENCASSSPSKTALDIPNDIYDRLVDAGNPQALSNPHLRDQIHAHFSRLPAKYQVDLNFSKPDDVLLHIKILAEAEDPEKRPVFYVRFTKHTKSGVGESSARQQFIATGSSSNGFENGYHFEDLAPHLRDRLTDSEASSKLEGLYLGMNDSEDETEERKYSSETHSANHDIVDSPVHEIIFSSIDKPKLLSQLSSLLSDVGLDIREAHVFSTTDGYSLDVFEVAGWSDEGTEGLLKELNMAAARYEGSLSGSPKSSASDKLLAELPKAGDCEINGRSLKLGDKFACGSCGDLYCGTYMGDEVAVKVLRAEHLTESLEREFYQEIYILKNVVHKNIVRFIGACTKPRFVIVTEYMTGGNLYDYLHKKGNHLELPQLLKFSIDICKGMGYLHKNNIIHRDLKTANLLMDGNNV